MKARKHLCVLGTHPNLVPQVTETMQKIKRTCREEKQTLTKSKSELEKEVSTMRYHCLNTYCVQDKGSSFPLTWLCVYV